MEPFLCTCYLKFSVRSFLKGNNILVLKSFLLLISVLLLFLIYFCSFPFSKIHKFKFCSFLIYSYKIF